MSENERKVTRRQFLTYTLTGVGGFMAASMLTPMVRAALDPVLKPESKTDMVAIAKISDITNEPKRFDFKVKQVDAWYKSDEPKSAWVYKNESGDIVALSPVCKHLGCTVNWNADKGHPNQFFCPCHGGRYEKDGINIPGTPPLAPLDLFDSTVKDGTLYVGKTKAHGGGINAK